MRVLRQTSGHSGRRLWTSISYWKRLKITDGYYGVYLGVDHGKPLDYLAGMSVGPEAEMFRGVVKRQLPAALYAIFTCDFVQIGPTYGDIFNEWLPQSGYAQDLAAFGFDYYPPGMDQGAQMEIWFPVKMK